MKESCDFVGKTWGRSDGEGEDVNVRRGKE